MCASPALLGRTAAPMEEKTRPCRELQDRGTLITSVLIQMARSYPMRGSAGASPASPSLIGQLPPAASGQQLMNDVSVHVRQPAVGTIMADGQSFVIDAEQM